MWDQEHQVVSPIIPSEQVPDTGTDSDEEPYNFVVYNGESSSSQFSVVISPLTQVEDISQCKDLRIEMLSNHLWMRPLPIAFIDCDANGTTINGAIASMQEDEVPCGVFYSSTESSCEVADNQEWIKKSVPNLFTVTTSGAGLQLLSMLATADDDVRGSISGGPKFTDHIGALITLYVAMGVFALALLTCFVGGLIRVYRHPERYIYGTNRQRARGMARAMLDTIPLVRVRDDVLVGGADQQLDAELQGSGKRAQAKTTNLNNSDVGSKSQMIHDSPFQTAVEPNIDNEPREELAGIQEQTPSPAIICAPAPGKVNTYAFSGGVRTPQRTPILTPGNTPGGRSLSGGDVPPHYSSEEFPFPVIHDSQPSTPLESIEECRTSTKSTSTPVLVQQPSHALNSPLRQRLDEDALSAGIPREKPLELPPEPPSRRIKPSPISDGRLQTKPRVPAAARPHDKSRNIGVYMSRDDDVCSICFDDVRAGDLLRVLPCGHHFHATCLDPWLLKSASTCPLCRTDLIKHAKDMKNISQTNNLNSRLDHTLSSMRRQFNQVTQSIKSEISHGVRAEATHVQEQSSANVSEDQEAHRVPVGQNQLVSPSLRRSNTTPVRGLLRLLPITPTNGHLLSIHRGKKGPDTTNNDGGERSPHSNHAEALTKEGVAPSEANSNAG